MSAVDPMSRAAVVATDTPFLALQTSQTQPALLLSFLYLLSLLLSPCQPQGSLLTTGGRLEGNQGRANYSKDNEKSLTIFLKKQTNNLRIIIFAFIADEKKYLFYINTLFP